jgi:hypothetical protein
MKGYAGGLGASAFDCLHIGLLGFPARGIDDVGVSFTVLSGLSRDDFVQTETDHVGLYGSCDRCAKVRRQEP